MRHMIPGELQRRPCSACARSPGQRPMGACLRHGPWAACARPHALTPAPAQAPASGLRRTVWGGGAGEEDPRMYADGAVPGVVTSMASGERLEVGAVATSLLKYRCVYWGGGGEGGPGPYEAALGARASSCCAAGPAEVQPARRSGNSCQRCRRRRAPQERHAGGSSQRPARAGDLRLHQHGSQPRAPGRQRRRQLRLGGRRQLGAGGGGLPAALRAPRCCRRPQQRGGGAAGRAWRGPVHGLCRRPGQGGVWGPDHPAAGRPACKLQAAAAGWQQPTGGCGRRPWLEGCARGRAARWKGQIRDQGWWREGRRPTWT